MAKKQQKFTVACVQLNSKQSISKNLSDTKKYINKACDKGVDFVLTPEVSNIVSLSKNHLLENTYLEDKDPFLSEIKLLAKKRSVWILLGSIIIKDKKNKLYNRSYLINSSGKIVSKYDKIHMFDVNISKGESYKESSIFTKGKKIITAKLPWGRIGMSICYDLRFPTLYRKLCSKGANMISIPAAFTRPTGKAHWQTLIKSRAIENSSFVFAPAQCGVHSSSRKTYGHSLIVSPWGEIIAEMKGKPGIISAIIDISDVLKVRKMIPSYKVTPIEKR
jgi:predicted amidohydrolase